MLVQDVTTGALHEVPDTYGGYGLAESPEYAGYAGYGAPYGLFTGIIKAAGSLISPIARGVGRLIRGRPRIPLPFPRPPFLRPPLPGQPFPRPPWMRQRFPGMPPGWRRPFGPMGAHGRSRLYLRCSTWPGPPGLVPPAFPGAAVPGGAGGPRRRRRRGGRRRRR
jgi:hypothetical protein